MNDKDRNNIQWIIGLLVIAAVCSFILARCGSEPVIEYKTGKTTHDTLTVRDTMIVKFPQIKYLQQAKTVLTIKDTISGRIDTVRSIDSVFQNILVVSKTDTTIISEIQTKYGPISDTTEIKSVFRLPDNTAEFFVKRSELNIEKVIQTIINSTTVTPVRSSTFLEDAGKIGAGLGAGYLLGRAIR